MIPIQMSDFYLQPNAESSRFPPQAESSLRDLLRSTLGAHARLANYTILKSHHDYIVLSAKLERPSTEVIIKLAGPDAALPCPFDRTAALHGLLRAQTAAPVPEVLAADVSYNSWPVRYMIKIFAPGVE